jgi:hypothetical protein
MTQGHLYHLGATKQEPGNTTLQTGIAQQDTCNKDNILRLQRRLRALRGMGKEQFSTPIHLDHRDFSSANTPNTIEEREKDSKKPVKYVAYHVGQTCYSPCDVLALSRMILHHMCEIGIGSYDMFENNC